MANPEIDTLPLMRDEPGGSGRNRADGEGQGEGSRPTTRRPSTRLPHPAAPPTGGDGIERRDVEPADVAEKLRGMLGLLSVQPAPGEAAASLGRSLPSLVQGLDAGGWIAWCLVGLILFGESFPPLAMVRRESKRFAVSLAMLRAQGNISAAARMLGTSRKVLRDNLQDAGLYPWPVIVPQGGGVLLAPRSAAGVAKCLGALAPVLDLAKARHAAGATRTDAIEHGLRVHPVPLEIAEAGRVVWQMMATPGGDQGGLTDGEGCS